MVVKDVASFSDSITPFLIDRAGVRGRVVRLGGVAQAILARYDYPQPVARLLGELLLVAAMLSSNLKQEGIFTIQIRSEKGPVRLVVVDAVYGGALRGFAEVPEEAKKEIARLGEQPTLKQLLGEDAYFAITLDPGEGMHRYQGVVAIEGDNVTDMLGHYFTQSQQLDVMFKLAVDRLTLPATTAPVWMAAGIMIERLPEEDGATERLGSSLPLESNTTERLGSSLPLKSDHDHEGWRYGSAMVNTVKNEELLDPLLDAETLLHQLFHEEGVWVYAPQLATVGCRCSRERILSLLRSMPLEERADMLKKGEASVHCQFCNKSEVFTAEELSLSTH